MNKLLTTVASTIEETLSYWLGELLPRPEVAFGEDSRDPYCSWCGQTARDDEYCSCGSRRLMWNRVIRLGAYEPPLSACITSGKYKRWKDILELMGTKLGERVRGCVPSNTLVVPMPMSFSRWYFRGMNHAAILAKHTARSARLKRRNLLLRKETPPQASLTEAGRLRLKGDSVVPIPLIKLRGSPVVLVDDVLTTGRSLEVAARALRSVGASTITVAVAAVTNMPEWSKKVKSASITP
jgi:ComF family protein